jgi:CTP synthase (UTP-ammonia lyase)
MQESLELLQNNYAFKYEWIDTDLAVKNSNLQKLCGIWSASGSPFKNIEGVLNAIHYARTNNIPYLGTCGGFQHTIIEYAKNVLNISDADHEEYNPSSKSLIITKMSCSLAGTKSKVIIKENSFAYSCYKSHESIEDFFCSYGINPTYTNQILNSDLKISGVDTNNDIRIIELSLHPYFIATLFVPQTKIENNTPHPLIARFIEKCIENAGKQ